MEVKARLAELSVDGVAEPSVVVAPDHQPLPSKPPSQHPQQQQTLPQQPLPPTQTPIASKLTERAGDHQPPATPGPSSSHQPPVSNPSVASNVAHINPPNSLVIENGAAKSERRSSAPPAAVSTVAGLVVNGHIGASTGLTDAGPEASSATFSHAPQPQQLQQPIHLQRDSAGSFLTFPAYHPPAASQPANQPPHPILDASGFYEPPSSMTATQRQMSDPSAQNPQSKLQQQQHQGKPNESKLVATPQSQPPPNDSDPAKMEEKLRYEQLQHEWLKQHYDISDQQAAALRKPPVLYSQELIKGVVSVPEGILPPGSQVMDSAGRIFNAVPIDTASMTASQQDLFASSASTLYSEDFVGNNGMGGGGNGGQATPASAALAGTASDLDVSMVSTETSSANASVDAGHFSTQDSITQSSRPKELKTNSSNIDDLGRNLVALLGAPRKKESTPVLPNAPLVENVNLESASSPRPFDAADLGDVNFEGIGEGVAHDLGAVVDSIVPSTPGINSSVIALAPDGESSAVVAGAAAALNASAAVIAVSQVALTPTSANDGAEDFLQAVSSPSLPAHMTSVPSGGAVSPVAAHGPIPIPSISHGQGPHVGHLAGGVDCECSPASVSTAPAASFLPASATAPVTPVYVLSRSIPASLPAASRSTANGHPLTPDAKQEKQILDAATKGEGDVSKNAVSEPTTLRSATSSGTAISPSLAAPPKKDASSSALTTNRFQKGRFQVLTVEEYSASPFKDTSAHDGGTVPAPANGAAIDIAAAANANAIHGREAVASNSTPFTATSASTENVVASTAVPATTMNGESGSTASGSYVTAATSEWERYSSSSISPSTSAESTASSGVGINDSG